MPRIKDLTTKTGNLSSADQFVSDNGTSVTKIDYTALARAIIEQYNGSTLAGSAQSVQAALNSLNSNLPNLTSGTIFDYVKSNISAGIQKGNFLATSAVSDIPSSNSYWFISYVRNAGSNLVQVKATKYDDSRVRYNTVGNITSTTFARDWTQEPTRAEMDAALAATTITQLRNTDLNTLTEPMRIYYAGGSHGCTNVPASAGSFGLIVLQISSGYRAQICISSGLNVYIRRYDSNSWGSWFEFTKSAIS